MPEKHKEVFGGWLSLFSNLLAAAVKGSCWRVFRRRVGKMHGAGTYMYWPIAFVLPPSFSTPYLFPPFSNGTHAR